MECFLCLEFKNNKIDCIKFKSTEWKELQIELILEKHLWPMQSIFEHLSNIWLCTTCWNTLYEFHKFYKRIEHAHAHLNYESVIKSETNINLSDGCLAVDIFSQNLAEPEIDLANEIDAAPVKEEENDEEKCGYLKNYEDEDDIPLIHMTGLEHCNSLLKADITKNETKLKDPLDRPRPAICETSYAKKSKVYVIDATKENTESLNNSIVCDRMTDASFEEIVGGLINIKNNKHQSSTATYFYESRLSCREYDDFIKKHFKLTCCKCQMSFNIFSELQTHFHEFHKGRGRSRGYVVCCETKYFDRSLLVDHINMHMNPEYFKCKYCPKVLTQRRNYNIHMRSHDKPLSCDICGKKFERKCFLNYHRQTHLSKEEKSIPCTDCGKLFASQYLLRNHWRVIHLRKYAKLCNICGQSLINLEAFKRHMKLHDAKTTDPPLSCEFCGLLVSSDRYLKAHIKSKHTADAKKEKVCPICHKVLQNIDGLRHHIRRNHDTGYIHKCTICEKAFKRVDHLKAHMNIHTGANKSKCPWCPRTFNANSTMHHHRKQVHRKEWEEERRKKYIEKLPTNLESKQANQESACT